MDPRDGIHMDFCSLGMFIIDDIEFAPPRKPVKDILGGAGSWSALGARLFSPPPVSKSVGWVVDAGSDFPVELRHIIRSWETSCVLRETPDRKTTRGRNVYGENEDRAFEYVEPKLRIDHTALPQSHLLAKSFHLICNPTRCIDLITNILAEREMIFQRYPPASGALPLPLFIWEPVPDRCTEEEKENMYRALKFVNVMSPNYVEISGFYDACPSPSGEIGRGYLASMCNDVLLRGFGSQKNGAIVVRAGRDGCYVATHGFNEWLPAYHKPPDDPEASSNLKVVDPTGGGNAFLGGLAIGLVRTGSEVQSKKLRVASAYASVAASFAVEQVGMPKLSRAVNGSELWNGVRVAERLDEYLKSLPSSRVHSTTYHPAIDAKG